MKTKISRFTEMTETERYAFWMHYRSSGQTIGQTIMTWKGVELNFSTANQIISHYLGDKRRTPRINNEYTSEIKMMVFDHFMRTGDTYEGIIAHFPELDLQKSKITKCIEYGKAQLAKFDDLRKNNYNNIMIVSA